MPIFNRRTALVLFGLSTWLWPNLVSALPAQGAASVTRPAAAAPTIRIFPTGRSGSRPQGLALANDGTLWFTDGGNDQVGHFDPQSGAFSFYPLPARSLPGAIAVDAQSGDVWLALSPPSPPNAPSDRASATGTLPAGSPPGTAVTVYLEAEKGLPIPKPSDPSRNLSADGISIDAGGQVWATHSELTGDYNDTYYELMRTGVGGYLGSPNTHESPIGQVMNNTNYHKDCEGPQTTAVDAAGNVWIACAFSDVIAEFTTDEQLRVFPVGEGPRQIAFDSAGDVWFTAGNLASGSLGRLDPHKAVPGAEPAADPGLTEFGVDTDLFPANGTPAEGLAVDLAGDVWFTVTGPCLDIENSQNLTTCVARYSPASGRYQVFSLPRPITDSGSRLPGNALLIDSAGNVWYAGFNGESGKEVGYLAEIVGVAPAPALASGGVQGGQVSTAGTIRGFETPVQIPAGTTVARRNGKPFSGVIAAAQPYAGTLPPLPDGRPLVPGSAYQVATITPTGQFEPVSFSQPVTLSFPVTLPPGTPDADVWTYDPVARSWQRAGGDAGDPGGHIAGGRATVQAKHLSIFAVTPSGNPVAPTAPWAYLPFVNR